MRKCEFISLFPLQMWVFICSHGIYILILMFVKIRIGTFISRLNGKKGKSKWTFQCKGKFNNMLYVV